MILSFFVPHQVGERAGRLPAAVRDHRGGVRLRAGRRQRAASQRRRRSTSATPGWPYKLVLVVSLIATVVIGVARGPRASSTPGMRSKWIYDNLYSPMSATMFALLAFFIASAAFRAFRIRTRRGRAAGGRGADRDARTRAARPPRSPAGCPDAAASSRHAQEWIMEVPQNAAKRAILIGAALGRHGDRAARDPRHRALVPERGGLSA